MALEKKYEEFMDPDDVAVVIAALEAEGVYVGWLEQVAWESGSGALLRMRPYGDDREPLYRKTPASASPAAPAEPRADDEMKRMIDERRDPEFMERLRTRVVEDGPLLDRLAATGPSLRDKTEPCGSTARAVLGAVDPEGAWLYCGLLRNHAGPHIFHMEWLMTEVSPDTPREPEPK
jgi:hypothetical protein